MEFVEIISKRVTEYYIANPPAISQIQHTQTVAAYTRLIAAAEGIEGHQLDLMEAAAWLHDVGCPNARKKYGNALPVHQQDEGRALVHDWLNDADYLTNDEKQWLADVVGTHHQPKSALTLHFEPLLEADAIVNLIEGNHRPEQAQSIYNGWFTTHYGKQLFQKLFLD